MSQFDLASLDSAAKAEDGAELEVLHPISGEKLGIAIRLAGTDSAVHRKATTAIASRRTKGGFRRNINLDDLQAESIEILARCTLSWSGVVLDGKDVPPSKEAAAALYTRFPWLREQVETFISDRANYLQD
ncbi:hypothetical protein [Bilophila wadsworthia]|uniref:hypothetical protein n=1 Tax=Bilophila wadsworthia TaxID=35833 RepID=UPI00267631FF|nr:hypothetical protein [Bilophila wadsworthia]